jgi:hypothetical protein
MIGHLFPPGNFVGSEGEVSQQPWLAYESANRSGDRDHFGNGHADDVEGVGPYARLSVTCTLRQLLAGDRPGSRVEPGLYMDASGRLSDSPFASEGFAGAVGVEVLPAGATAPQKLPRRASGKRLGDVRRTADPGTAGASLPYSVHTGGVVLSTGRPC